MLWTLSADPSGRSGTDNMAIDYALLCGAQRGCGYVRLYRWCPPCLSFGRNEPAKMRYNAAKIARLGIDTVRRPTGGRAVWHDAELTYAVAAPAATFGSLRETYNIVHATLAAALRRLGVKAELAPRPSGRRPGITRGSCFSSAVGGELVVDGRKLVGSAQIREGDAFLQHGSILLEGNQEVVEQVTQGDAVGPKATSLSALLARSVTFSELAGAIEAEVVESWSGNWQITNLTVEPVDRHRFADEAWTWRR
ncbi:MAG: biotin/lipoate A/B protein ligase family protein [Gemmatimonadales bacterium]